LKGLLRPQPEGTVGTRGCDEGLTVSIGIQDIPNLGWDGEPLFGIQRMLVLTQKEHGPSSSPSNRVLVQRAPDTRLRRMEK
jgi:hypothetical protein